MTTKTNKTSLLASLLALLALALLIASYFAPIWWVSLTAPNYPPDAFPDGIRIHFHFDAVKNGCTTAGKGSQLAGEVIQGDLSGDDERWNPILDPQKDVDKNAEALDCVHEMNTINHYVGMFPIGTGAPVERPLSKFFFGFFAVMILGFVTPQRKWRLAVLGAGFAAVAAWMLYDQFGAGQLAAHVQTYRQDAGAFFREPERIAVWGARVSLASKLVIGGLIAAMLVVVAGVARTRKFQLALALAPAFIPLYFLLTYSAWLWFFGHNLHRWGAFTVKPFMPTVFGEGKVAQFSTYSYPYWGFALLALVFVLLMLATLLRRKALNEQPDLE